MTTIHLRPEFTDAPPEPFIGPNGYRVVFTGPGIWSPADNQDQLDDELHEERTVIQFPTTAAAQVAIMSAEVLWDEFLVARMRMGR